jgi:predicted ester cyclase
VDVDAWIGFNQTFRAAFPDGRHGYDDVVACADGRIATRMTYTGTQTGEFQGIAPTGRKIALTALTQDRIVEGRLVEHIVEFDTASLLAQLGGGPEAQNRALIAAHFARVDASQWDEVVAHVSPAIRVQMGGQKMDRDCWVAAGRAFYDGFPDGKHVVEEILAAGDRTTVIGTWTGTHTGEFQGLPPTRKKVTVSFISVTRFAAGKIVEHHTELDAAGMMHQLMGAT